jgi:hypothetical protein
MQLFSFYAFRIPFLLSELILIRVTLFVFPDVYLITYPKHFAKLLLENTPMSIRGRNQLCNLYVRIRKGKWDLHTFFLQRHLHFKWKLTIPLCSVRNYETVYIFIKFSKDIIGIIIDCEKIKLDANIFRCFMFVSDHDPIARKISTINMDKYRTSSLYMIL